MQWYESTQAHPFVHKQTDVRQQQGPHRILLGTVQAQTIRGFGGCFNELGWLALQDIAPQSRADVFQQLFTKDGLDLGFCRIPIGANDYAAEWYSCDETDGDIDLSHFTLERDKKFLIPYIQQAQALHPGMKFFASPWSPPTWMKTPKVYNYGRMRMEPEILHAYAEYLEKFVEGYADAGIEITQLHVQNEPFADQKFPSCLWYAEDLRTFIRDYIGPLFAQKLPDVRLFLGTFNGPEEMNFSPYGITLDNYNKYVDTILFDEKARSYLGGMGYQWAGRGAVAKTHLCFPELELIQTENECGAGKNSWEYAQYIFNLMCHYFRCGVTAYTYWNMVLAPGGKSTWGWNQNAMVTVDPAGKVTYNPEFYVMKHFAHFVQPGAAYLPVTGHWASAAAAFRNPDGSIVLAVQNAMDRAAILTVENGSETSSVTLAPNSFNTLVF
jgi:glucosylceramidase